MWFGDYSQLMRDVCIAGHHEMAGFRLKLAGDLTEDGTVLTPEAFYEEVGKLELSGCE